MAIAPPPTTGRHFTRAIMPKPDPVRVPPPIGPGLLVAGFAVGTLFLVAGLLVANLFMPRFEAPILPGTKRGTARADRYCRRRFAAFDEVGRFFQAMHGQDFQRAQFTSLSLAGEAAQ
ncbi:MAG: hypothetical protein GC191_20015 [Azospirillum sp.]|nr:hypothetical protein [Azospirillum sp.]